MIELNEEQWHAVKQGELVRAFADGQAVLLLRPDVFWRIQGVLEVEKAIIQAGHIRESAEAPELLEAMASIGDELVLLPTDREDEIRELVVDDRERSGWQSAVEDARGFWAQENSD